jgi:adenosylcobinamide hydrolase
MGGNEMKKELKVDVELRSMGDETFAIIRFPQRMRVLSSTLRNGGFTETDTILMMQVERGYDRNDPEADMASKISLLGLEEHTVGFMTAAEIRKAIIVAEERYHGVHAIAVVTAGVVNAVMAGELLPDSVVHKLTKPGTINIVAVVDVPLECAGSANAMITITEAKSAAMFDRGIRGTGTTSDAVAIASPVGEGTKYAGTATDVGIAIARAVRKATSGSIRKWSLVNPPMDFLSLLERKGVTMDDLWTIVKDLPCPARSRDVEGVHRRFVQHLESLKDDVNVNSLVQAAVLMDDEGDRDNIRGVNAGGYHNDPEHLVVDKILGNALRGYLEGKLGPFEHANNKMFRSGKMEQVGPFLDDILGALVAGTMSRIDTEWE